MIVVAIPVMVYEIVRLTMRQVYWNLYPAKREKVWRDAFEKARRARVEND